MNLKCQTIILCNVKLILMVRFSTQSNKLESIEMNSLFITIYVFIYHLNGSRFEELVELQLIDSFLSGNIFFTFWCFENFNTEWNCVCDRNIVCVFFFFAHRFHSHWQLSLFSFFNTWGTRVAYLFWNFYMN